MADNKLLLTRLVNNNFHRIDSLFTHTKQLTIFHYLILCSALCWANLDHRAGRIFHEVGPNHNSRLRPWLRSRYGHDPLTITQNTSCLYLDALQWHKFRSNKVRCLRRDQRNCLVSRSYRFRPSWAIIRELSAVKLEEYKNLTVQITKTELYIYKV